MFKKAVKHIQPGILLYSIIVGVITLRDTDCTVNPGLDSPFRWALNYFLAFDRRAFDHLQYTVGPLCFLKWPSPIGGHILISTLFYWGVASLFTYLFTLFYAGYRNTTQYIVPLLACTVLLLTVNTDIIICGCVLLSILFYRFLDSKGVLSIGILLTIIGLYLKTSVFVFILFIWIAFSIHLIAMRRFKHLLGIVVAGIILYFICGLALFTSVGGIVNYGVSNFCYAFKYSDSLSLYPYNNWIALGICLLSILALLFIFRKGPGGFVLNMAALCLFSVWKYSMGREDFFHAIYFSYFLALFLVLFLAVQTKKAVPGALLFLSAICFYNFNLKNVFEYREHYFWFPGIINFNERIIHYNDFNERMVQESKQSCAPNVVPAEWRKVIGNSTVDIIPWDLSIIYINGFSFRSRPCLQSQSWQNDFLDATFLKSSNSARYIIWHTTPGDKTSIDGLDNQYIPNTCPATIEALLTDYKLTAMTNGRFAVWEKLPVSRFIDHKMIKQLSVAWGSWIDIPAHDSASVIKAMVNYSSTMLYDIRSFLYKGRPVYIEYESDNGKVMKYNFSKQCAGEGLFVNPLWTDNRLHATNIKRIRFVTDAPANFRDSLKVTLENAELK